MRAQATAYLLPFGINVFTCDGCVGVRFRQRDVVALRDLWHLALDGQDGLPLCIGLFQGGLELLVGFDQALTEEEKSRVTTSILSILLYFFYLYCHVSHFFETSIGPSSFPPTWISSMLWTINMSCRSSIADSIQLLNGAALFAYSRWSSSIASSCFSFLC